MADTSEPNQNGNYRFGLRIQSRPSQRGKDRYLNVRRDLQPLGDTGLEHNVESTEKQTVPSQGGAESGAVLPPGSAALTSELMEIIAKWWRLPAEMQRAILEIIRISC
jgi:hypothetical protein